MYNQSSPFNQAYFYISNAIMKTSLHKLKRLVISVIYLIMIRSYCYCDFILMPSYQHCVCALNTKQAADKAIV